MGSCKILKAVPIKRPLSIMTLNKICKNIQDSFIEKYKFKQMILESMIYQLTGSFSDLINNLLASNKEICNQLNQLSGIALNAIDKLGKTKKQKLDSSQMMNGSNSDQNLNV